MLSAENVSRVDAGEPKPKQRSKDMTELKDLKDTATATATITMEPFVATVERIVLNISREEAQTLADILHRIGGDPQTSRRQLVNNMKIALSASGIMGKSTGPEITGHLYFEV